MINVTNEGKITIDASNLDLAKQAAALIKDRNLRKKYYASTVAILTFIDAMQKEGILIKRNTSLSKVPSIAEVIDLSNVCYKKLQIDVRVILDGEDVYIPKSHKRNDIIPDIYVCAKLNKNFNYIEFLGFIETTSMPEMVDLKEYYSISTSELSPMEDLPHVLNTKKPQKKDFEISEHAKIQEMFVNYFDNKLSRVEKLYLIKHVFYCAECRKKFLNFYSFDAVSKFVPEKPEITKQFKQLDISNNVLESLSKELKESKKTSSRKEQPQAIEMTLRNDIYTIEDGAENEDSIEAKMNDEDFFARVRQDIQRKEKQQPFKNKFKRTAEDDEDLIEELRKNSTAPKATKGNISGKLKDEEITRQKEMAQNLLKKNNKKVSSKNVESNVRSINAEDVERTLTTEKAKEKARKKDASLKQVAGHMNLNKKDKETAAMAAKKTSAEKKIKHPINKIDLEKNPTDNDTIHVEQTRKADSFVDKFIKSKKENKKLKYIAASVLICGLALGCAYYGFKHYKPAAEDPVVATTGELTTIEMNNDLQKQATASMGMQKAISEGFNDYTSAIDVSNIAWEVAPEYTSNQNFIDFLQNAGVALQSNVQDSLMNIGEEESAIGDHIKVAFTLSKDLGVKDFQIEETTGSETIDETIKDSVLSTLKYFNYPEVGKGIDNVEFKLLIEF